MTRNTRHFYKFVLLLVPVAISAFTHLWNLDGFPSIYRDEDHYLRKTLHVLRGLGPQENPDELVGYPSHPYTHPYFGQLFLATVLGAIGYPEPIQPSVDASSIKELFVVPRIIIGILAVLDTFLLFKITERRYDSTTAFIASVLFAVMPMTWIIRRVWLEPIQLPFLLASILIALYIKNYEAKGRTVTILVTMSGSLFGLAIFTKIPVITLAPLVVYIIYSDSKSHKSRKLIGLWILPVLLIPLSWPLHAISMGEYNEWIDGVLWQSERENMGLTAAIGKLFAIDPVLILISFVATAYAVLRRNLFIILWLVPFLLFNLLSGFVSYWHLIPLLPAFCIGSAILIKDSSKLFRNNKIRKVLPYAIVSGIGTYGLIVMIMLLTLNLTSFHNQVISYISAQVQDTNATSTTHKSERVNTKHGIAVYGTNYWLWIPKYVFDRSGSNEFRNYYNAKDNITNNVLLVVGENFVRDMTRENDTVYNKERLRQFLNSSDLLTVIEENQSATLQRDKYPFNSLIDLDPRASSRVEIRANY